MPTRVLVLTLMLAVAVTQASAQTGGEAPLTPIPPGEQSPARLVHGPACIESYSNIGIPRGMYFPAGSGVEVLDDVHLGVINPTGLCAFDFGYYKATPGATTVTVTFYANDMGDRAPGATLATFVLPNMPSGENGFHVEVPGSSLGRNVWMGVQFNTADTGLQLSDQRWPGASDDWFLLRPPNEYYNFGGNPRADFLLGVYATGSPVTVDPEGPLVTGFRRQPSPNPSTRGIEFSFALRERGNVRADVLDVSGRSVAVIANGVFQPGVHPLSWDGTTARGARAPAGVYLIRLTMPGFGGSRKVLLVH